MASDGFEKSSRLSCQPLRELPELDYSPCLAQQPLYCFLKSMEFQKKKFCDVNHTEVQYKLMKRIVFPNQKYFKLSK